MANHSFKKGNTMKKTVLLAMLGMLCLTGRKTEAALISVGDFSVVEGTPSIDIPVLITGGEDIASAALWFSVGDAGPFFNGTETITISAVDFTTGTIWAGQSLDTSLGLPSPGPAMQIANVKLTTQNLNVVAAGLLMTFTLDLSTAEVGEFLLLDPNLMNMTEAANGQLVPVNLNLTFNSGSLTITSGTNGSVHPEPSSLLLFAVGVVGIAGYNRKRKRQTAA